MLFANNEAAGHQLITLPSICSLYHHGRSNCRMHSRWKGYLLSTSCCYLDTELSGRILSTAPLKCCFNSENATQNIVKVNGNIILRPTVSRPVRPGIRHPSGTRDQIFPFSFLFFLPVSGLLQWGALSDEKSGLLLLAQPTSTSNCYTALLGEESEDQQQKASCIQSFWKATLKKAPPNGWK
jgi:hypothetical protein